MPGTGRRDMAKPWPEGPVTVTPMEGSVAGASRVRVGGSRYLPNLGSSPHEVVSSHAPRHHERVPLLSSPPPPHAATHSSACVRPGRLWLVWFLAAALLRPPTGHVVMASALISQGFALRGQQKRRLVYVHARPVPGFAVR
jgi:hypothetical protein